MALLALLVGGLLSCSLSGDGSCFTAVRFFFFFFFFWVLSSAASSSLTAASFLSSVLDAAGCRRFLGFVAGGVGSEDAAVLVLAPEVDDRVTRAGMLLGVQWIGLK